MLLLPAAIGTFLLVNLLCACLALGVGFAAGVWFFGAKMAKPADEGCRSRSRPQSKLKLRNARPSGPPWPPAASPIWPKMSPPTSATTPPRCRRFPPDSPALIVIRKAPTRPCSPRWTKCWPPTPSCKTGLPQAEKQLATQAAEIKTHESEARTDSLTGLANRRAFDDELKRRLSEWQRKGTPCTLVLIDIDFFKKFNDTHGHQVGDEVLRQMGSVLSKQSRDMDVPCRYGGEEFAVILPTTEASKACIVAERIRTAVEQSTTVCDGKSLKVTCSLGVSEFLADDDVARLIRRADDALYVSKKAGRNNGHWNTGSTHVPITSPEQGIAAPEPPPAEPTSCELPKPPAPTGANFIQLLKRRVTESHRFGVPISVAYLKIEEYDIINRKYGSPIARQMVDAAAPGIQKALREMDVMAKLENGEFVIMLPGSTLSEVSRVVKRMRSNRQLCAAARRSPAADSLSPRRRRAPG